MCSSLTRHPYSVSMPTMRFMAGGMVGQDEGGINRNLLVALLEEGQGYFAFPGVVYDGLGVTWGDAATGLGRGKDLGGVEGA